MSRKQPVVVKSTGEREPFDLRKLRRSLRRAGASEPDVAAVLDAVGDQLRDGITTRRLHRIAHQTLRHLRRPTAARYSLQRAILELGPSGFPFEHFVGQLLREDGYQVRVGPTLRGRFVSHEIDVEATRQQQRVLAECKFRLAPNAKVDVKVALYVYARALDLGAVGDGNSRFWLVTNARFTDDAWRYGTGMGLELVSWERPAGQGLRERVDRAGLHPLTCLTGLKREEKRRLLARDRVLVRQLAAEPKLLDDLGLGHRRLRAVRSEIEALCQTDGTAAGAAS